MTLKGYADQQKHSDLAPQFATVAPVRAQQYALDVIAHTGVYEVGTDAAEASSTTRAIVATSHAARKGDVVRFTAGALSGYEFRVAAVDTDSITVAEVMPAAPAAADAFAILRHRYLKVESDGSLPISFSADTGAGNTEAETLRVRIANDQQSLPIDDDGGSITVDDGGTSLTVDGTVAATQSGTWDITDITGTVSLPTGAATAAKQDDAQTTLDAIDTKLGGTLTVQATNLDVRDLSSAQDSVAAVQSGTWNVTDISGTVSLPTGAATETKQDTGNASLSSIDGKLANGTGAASGALRVVLATDVSSKGRASVLTVSQDLSSVTDSAYTEIDASTSADINELSAFESSGQGLILATGASSSEVDVLYIPPGGFGHTVPLYIPSGTRLSIKALLGNPTDGRLVANFLN